MLGLIGAVVFGAVFAGSWMIAEGDEQKSREDSKRSGKSLYIDKNGKFRHTDTGKRYTTEDAIRNIKKFNKEYEDRRREYEDSLRIKYWGFKRCSVVKENREIFLNKTGVMGDKPVLEIYSNYDDCEVAFNILKQEYLDAGVEIMEIVKYGWMESLREADVQFYQKQGYPIHYNF